MKGCEGTQSWEDGGILGERSRLQGDTGGHRGTEREESKSRPLTQSNNLRLPTSQITFDTTASVRRAVGEIRRFAFQNAAWVKEMEGGVRGPIAQVPGVFSCSRVCRTLLQWFDCCTNCTLCARLTIPHVQHPQEHLLHCSSGTVGIAVHSTSILLICSHFASVWEFCNDRLNVHNTMLTMFLGANRCVSTCACSCWWWVFDSSTSTYLCKAIGSPAIERPV